MARGPGFLRAAHALLWIAGCLGAVLFLLLCVAAYGIPGAWVQEALDAAVPAETGRLTVARVSYRLGAGIVLDRPLLCRPDGGVLASADRCAIGLRLFTLAPLRDRVDALSAERLYVAPGSGVVTLGRVALKDDALSAEDLAVRADDGYLLASFRRASATLREGPLAALPRLLERVSIDRLFVAQIRYDPNRVIERELPPPELRPPFPDLSKIPLPDIHALPFRLTDPDLLEIRARVLEGTLASGNGLVRLQGLRMDVDGTGRQLAEGELTLALPKARVRASIRGFIYLENLRGIWHAADLPVIEDYLSKIELNGPAWGDCSFTIGLNIYDDVFRLRTNFIAPQGGSYLGVPFDEAGGAITCRGIWGTKAEIGPIILRRGENPVASCDFHIDTDADRIDFSAQSTGLAPEEFLRLLELPDGSLPDIAADVSPTISISGHLPYYAETTPGNVFLRGHVAAPQGARVDRLPLAALETDLSMRRGVLSLNGLSATFPRGGAARGALSFAIPDGDAPATLSAALHLTDASLADLLGPYGQDALSKCVVTGFVDLRGRLDDTFPKSLQAEYNLTVDGGLIQRLPLFAGLTDLLADHVPGIASVTDSSSARLVGTTDGGIFNIPDFSLDGDLLSIEGPATYDLPNDNLDAEVTAGNFKKGSVMGTLTRWATVPVNRFLWRVHVSGPIAGPKWTIVTFLGRLLGQDTDKGQP